MGFDEEAQPKSPDDCHQLRYPFTASLERPAIDSGIVELVVDEDHIPRIHLRSSKVRKLVELRQADEVHAAMVSRFEAIFLEVLLEVRRSVGDVLVDSSDIREFTNELWARAFVEV